MIGKEKQEDITQSKIQKLEYDLIGRKIPNYFPTPKDIALRMITKANIQDNDIILEPSILKTGLKMARQSISLLNSIKFIE